MPTTSLKKDSSKELFGASVWIASLLIVGLAALLSPKLFPTYVEQRTMANTSHSSHFFALEYGQKLHYVSGGQIDQAHPYLFLLVHGASREHQNSQHWKGHYDYFAQKGAFLAVDMLGHGQSLHPTNPDDGFAAEQQVETLTKLLIQQSKEFPTARIVLVGRSYGGGIVTRLALAALNQSELQSRLAGIALIAPAVASQTVAALHEASKEHPLKAILFWATDDTAVPFANHSGIQKAFPEITFINMGKCANGPAWTAHLPENMQPEKFQQELSNFLTSIPAPKL